MFIETSHLLLTRFVLHFDFNQPFAQSYFKTSPESQSVDLASLELPHVVDVMGKSIEKKLISKRFDD